ncbi:MAG: TIGR04282 family arsenosugar biosynthesis glycosyltransferase [Bacteroidota bacterium]
MNKNHLIIFAKYPREGSVKKRLAEKIGTKKATDFYRACAEHTFSEAEKFGDCTIHIFYANESDDKDIRTWTKGHFFYKVQAEGDVGMRMTDAFREVLKTKLLKKDAKNIIIIGTDTPDISSEILQDAFKKLAENEVVIGPARNGGYYLLGMKKLHEELFRNIEWHTDSVFKTTMDIAQASNLSVAVLDELNDVDTEADVKIWMKKNGGHPLNFFTADLLKK